MGSWQRELGLDDSLLVGLPDAVVRQVGLDLARYDMANDIRTFSRDQALHHERWLAEEAAAGAQCFPADLRPLVGPAAPGLTASTSVARPIWSWCRPRLTWGSALRPGSPSNSMYRWRWTTATPGSGCHPRHQGVPQDCDAGRWESDAVGGPVPCGS